MTGSLFARDSYPLLDRRIWQTESSVIINRYIDTMPSVNVGNSFGATPLMFAAQYTEHLQHVKRLVARGASVKRRNRLGSNAVYYATANANVAVLQYLMTFEVSIFSTGLHKEFSPLFNAAANNSNPDMIDFLGSIGFDVNMTDTSGMTPLMYAVSENMEVAVAMRLIDHGARLDVQDSDGLFIFDMMQQRPYWCGIEVYKDAFFAKTGRTWSYLEDVCVKKVNSFSQGM